MSNVAAADALLRYTTPCHSLNQTFFAPIIIAAFMRRFEFRSGNTRVRSGA